MSHAIHRVEHFAIVGPYTLALRFDDGSEQRIDFRPVLEGEVFAPLQDLEMFNAVELDTTFGTEQWPNGADFDPETLHDWPKYRDELVAMARRWATTSNPPHRTANTYQGSASTLRTAHRRRLRGGRWLRLRRGLRT